MAAVDISFRGMAALKAKLRILEKEFPGKTIAALYLEAELIMADSKQNYVPVDWGPLRDSGFVKPPEGSGGETQIVLVYGGASSPYALAVHEHPSPHSPPTWKGKAIEEIKSVRSRKAWSAGEVGRGPKYLARPMQKALVGMIDRVASQVRP